MSDEIEELGFPGTALAGIADSNLSKHPGLDDLFKKALLGELPRSRALKSWEPDQLNETHLQIILLRAGGMRQRDIAKFLNATMGTKLTDTTVSICCNHPDAIFILTQLVSYAADNVTDMAARMKAYAGEALERNVQIMRTTGDQKLAARIGFDFLDRAGYGAVTKVAAKVEHSIMAPASAVNNLADALRETSQEVPANFITSGSTVLLGEGGGNALDDSESGGASGLPLASVPPTSASLSPLSAAKVLPDDEPEDQKDYLELRRAKRVA